MKELLLKYVENKKVAILGFGREGRSTLNLLMDIGGYSSIDILDQNPVEAIGGVATVCGEEYQDSLNNYDVVIKSPGIVLKDEISNYSCKILSQTEIFFERYKKQIIGITGTKGKSTTTTLIYHILKNAGYDTVLGGNIGIPAFDIIGQIKENTIIVFEMSSHMLEYMTVAPHIGVLMNIHEEHLDHYGTMEKYVNAKMNIIKNQEKDDICFVNKDIEVEAVSELIHISANDAASEQEMETTLYNEVIIDDSKIYFELKGCKYYYEIPIDSVKLIGAHNYFDVGIAYGILKLKGLSDEEFEKGLISYEPLPHRLQFIGEVNEVKFYDDSISTICDTTIQALQSIKNADTVLIGGMDRGIDYSELIAYLSESHVRNIILMYETGKRIWSEINDKYNDFNHKDRIHLVEDLEEAVELAMSITEKGKSCIMSPAAASYGYFKNFEERGDKFAQLVNLYKNKNIAKK